MEPISAVAAQDEVPGTMPPAAALPGAADLPFGRLVSEGLHALDTQLKTSQADLQQLALGEAQNLHEVMIRLEESRIAFQLMLQVRNRVLEAYQDVMKMQI
ncbi:MAG: fliE [Ramlibacter sp.]|nr:fliE [Ramlibacter sp.]